MDEAFSHVGAGAVGGRRSTRRIKGKEHELVAPDGGWGYAVCVGVGLVFMLGFGSSSAFGILFNDFFMQQGGASGLTLVIGVYNGSLSIFGFLSGLALKKYSFRQVGLVGALLFILGDIMTVFVTRTYQLVLTFGLIRGAGFGVMIPVGFTAFNCYFDKKRTTMMSANQTMSSMASITFPMLVTILLEAYGFRGTLALILAIDLHMVVAMIVMQPYEWHLVARPIVEYEVDGVNAKHHPLAIESVNSFMDGASSNSSSSDDSLHAVDAVKVSIKSHFDDKSGLIEKTLWNKVCQYVDLDLLRHPRFVSTLVGLGFAFVSDVTYLALEPMLLFYYGYSNVEVAFCVMLGATADLVARFLLALYTYFYSVNSRTLFFVGVCITVFMRVALVSGSAYWYICTVTLLSGCVRCTVQVLFPLVLSAAVPQERFPAALALHIIFSGVLMLLADPLIGVIYDVSGSYVYCFLTMSFCCLVCVVLWTAEFFFYRKRNK